MGRINWQEEAVKEWITYPEGIYKVKIVKWERKQSKNGNPGVIFTSEIQEPEVFKGNTKTEFISLLDTVLWKVAKFTHACGVDTSKLPVMDLTSKAFDSVLNACLGRNAYWVMVQRAGEKEGVIFNDVTDYKVDTKQEVIEPKVETELEWK